MTLEWKGRLQVLLVEDNHVNQIVALRLLEKRGYHCLVANNGRQALELVVQRLRANLFSWIYRCRKWTASRPHAAFEIG